uniref:Putative secreted protein n=1 Tax=Rhipicephalus microplus TaxID=6941 RepID=A0A6M2DBL0_RHIMP
MLLLFLCGVLHRVSSGSVRKQESDTLPSFHHDSHALQPAAMVSGYPFLFQARASCRGRDGLFSCIRRIPCANICRSVIGH